MYNRLSFIDDSSSFFLPSQRGFTMRILHIVAANMLTGGGERHVADLMVKLKERGHEVGLVAPLGGDLQEIAEANGVDYFSAEIGSGYSTGRVNRLRDSIVEYNPDIVHAHGHRAAFFARLADPKAAKRVVYTLHGIHIDSGFLTPFKKGAERYLYDRTAYFVVTAISDQEKALALNLADKNRLEVVYNGIITPEYGEKGNFKAELKKRGVSDDTVLFLHVGRLCAQKDHPTLVRAFSTLVSNLSDKQGHPDFHLAMICPGADNERDKLQASIDNAGLSDVITLMPGRSDIHDAYQDADVFVLSSLWEGTPYSLLEAMLAKTAIVSTNVGGLAEAVESGVSGELVDTKDAQSLAAAMRKMILEPQTREAYQERAHQIAKDRYTLDSMTDRLEAIYKKVLG